MSGARRLSLAVCAALGAMLATECVSAAELQVRTDFPGGSAAVVELDASLGLIHITPAVHPGRGWPCWWYFRVDGAEAGSKITLRVTANPQPFRAQEVLPAMWALPARAAISGDNVVWRHTEPGVLTTTSGTYAIVAPASTFWLAWGPPFLPAHADELLADAARRVAGAERFVLATTRGGLAVPAIRLGRADAPHAVWVQARQHAWEAGGSWVARGFLDWLASDDPAALAARAEAEFFVVPIMYLDNFLLGAGGKESVPRDHNRDWSAEPVYPEVAAAKKRVAALADAGRLRVFLDLHNPGPSDQRPFFYGPLDYEQMTAERRRPYDRFLELAAASISGPLALHPRYRFATYVRTEEERQRVSGTWVRQNTGPEVVALGFETSWNTPASTADGYLTVGRQLGLAVARYLAQAPGP